MKNLMKQTVVGAAVVMTLAASETLASAKEKGVSGSWTLSAEGYVLTPVLVQSGTKISGTFESTHGPMPLKGQFAKGRITFSGGGPNGIGGKEEFSATGVLQSDGTLVGDLTSATSGKLTWKAVPTAAR
jgi:hypothetical protein